MSYFKQFDQINYNDALVRNIANRVGFTSEVLGQLEVFQDVTLRDGQTPEMIAHDWYYDSEHVWLVLLTNNIIDPIYDWMLTQNQLDRYIEDKYEFPDQIKYYVNDGIRYSTKEIVPQHILDDILSNIVTFREWEVEENEKKRYIRVIKTKYLAKILEEFRIKIQSLSK